MDLLIALRRQGHLSKDLYAQIKLAIVQRRLSLNEALPPSRQLAASLKISRNTVIDAYDQLIAEQYLSTRIGAGTFVSYDGLTLAATSPRSSPLKPLVQPTRISLQVFSKPRPKFDFSVGLPDPSLFPWDAWRRALARQWKGRKPILGIEDIQGVLQFRSAIAHHIARSRSVKATEDDVLVTTGAQQAFHLIARTLLKPGGVVAVEEPGYFPARRVFEQVGARVVSVAVDSEGLMVSKIPARTKLVYATPSHQFPMGMSMSLQRRVALLKWSEAHDGAIIEDDYDSEFRFRGRPLESMQSLDTQGRVIYVGTYSKVMIPGLRLGFVVPPAPLMPSLLQAKYLFDSFTPSHPQLALAELMNDGFYARHLRRLQRVYQRRCEYLADSIERHFKNRARILDSNAGLHLSVLLPNINVDALVVKAKTRGVAVQNLKDFRTTKGEPGLVLGFGLIHERDIELGIKELCASL
jgi:GntR family transcriptional regulator / MocR family aminotransferase